MMVFKNGEYREATPEEEDAILVEQQAAVSITVPKYQPLQRLDFWLAAAAVGVTRALVRATADNIDDPIERERALIFIDEAQVYRREDPVLIQMAAAQGITEPMLDDLWAWATPA